jgi:hypothetical protein
MDMKVIFKNSGINPRQIFLFIHKMFPRLLKGAIARRAYSTEQTESLVKNVTIIGSGLMGSGIAQVFTFSIIQKLVKKASIG